jgi:hypothetical protein
MLTLTHLKASATLLPFHHRVDLGERHAMRYDGEGVCALFLVVPL